MENFTAAERETIIRWDDEADMVSIWSAQRPVITKLRRNPAFTEVKSGSHGSSPWAEFTIPVDRFTFGAKRVLSEETKATMRDRAKTLGWGRAS